MDGIRHRGGSRARGAIAWLLVPTFLAGCVAYPRSEAKKAADLPPLPGAPEDRPADNPAPVDPAVKPAGFEGPGPASEAPPSGVAALTLAQAPAEVPAPPVAGPFVAPTVPAPPPPVGSAGTVPQAMPLPAGTGPITPPPPPTSEAPPVLTLGEIDEAVTAPATGGLLQAGCPTCGGSGLSSVHGGGYSSCSSCGGTGCVPGRKPGQAFEAHTFVGRAFGNFYEALCCPDPCYEPSWIPEANAAFTLDYARPRTLMRVRYDHVQDLTFPDRNEFFWAQENIGSNGGRGPGKPARVKTAANFHGQPSLNYDQLSLYQEAATGRASFFIELPYVSVFPLIHNHTAGFGDMNLGTKAVLFDTELLLVSFQFRTYLPTGNPGQGTGNGHVSLEPSLLSTLRLASHTYLQGQLAEWIPIGGDPAYQGSILETRLSLNHVLLRLAPDFPLIGTLEGDAWSFQTGAYTDPYYTKQPQRYSGNVTYFNLGPGLRASVCDRMDFGGSITWPVGSTPGHYGDPWVRIEVRFLF